MSESNSAYCIQRNFRMFYATPPARLTLVSPYGQGYSEYDLNMRRKAEILQYSKPNTTGNLGNRMTRKELFAQTSRGFNPKQRTYRNATPEQLAFCDSSMNITSTAEADVPGPSQPLFLDKNVPLYMFSSGERNFSNNVETDTIPFVFHVVTPTVETNYLELASGVQTTIGVLDLKQSLDQQDPFFLQMTINNAIDLGDISEFRITYNSSPLIPRFGYSYLLDSIDDNTKTQVTIGDISIPTSQFNQSVFYEFQITFSTGVQIPVESIVLTQVKRIS